MPATTARGACPAEHRRKRGKSTERPYSSALARPSGTSLREDVLERRNHAKLEISARVALGPVHDDEIRLTRRHHRTYALARVRAYRRSVAVRVVVASDLDTAAAR